MLSSVVCTVGISFKPVSNLRHFAPRCTTLYCVLLQWCTKIRTVLTGRLTISGFDLAWFSSLSSERLCVFGFNGAI